MPSGKPLRKIASKPSAAKRPKKGKPSKPAVLSDGLRVGTGERITLTKVSYPGATDVIVFSPSTGVLELPDHAEQFLRYQIAPLAEEILDVLLTPPGELLFVVRMMAAGWQRLQQFLDQDIPVPNSDFLFNGRSMEFTIYLEICEFTRPAADALFSDASDFEMPSTTSESDADPEPALSQRKPKTTKAKREAPLPKNFLQAIRAPFSSLPPLPEDTAVAASPETMEVNEPEPIINEPEPSPSQTAAGVTPPLTGGETSQPTDSPTSALSSQPAPASRHPRRKLRYRTVDFTSLTVEVPEQPSVLTVLIKPLNQGDSLGKVHPKTLIADLSHYGDYTGLRDIRLGGLAVDFPKATDPAALLALTTLAGVPVSVELPRSATTCSAVLSGVNPLVTEEEVRLDLRTTPPSVVTSVKRLAKPGQESWSVKVTFEGTSLPDRGFLYGRSRRLLPYQEKPLFCAKCSRFGHSAKVCRSSRRCGTCSLDHEDAACPNTAKPLCPNCGGGHDAWNTACPARQFQMKVCAVKSASHVPHKVAKAAVSKAAKSYAEAARANQPKKPAAPAGPNFIPNVAHPRPPTAIPDSNQALATIFKGLIAILTAAIASGDLAGALQSMKGLFAEQVPGADPGLFAV